MFGLQFLGDEGAWKYAVRASFGLVLFVAFRPWRWYAPPRIRDVGPAIVTGIVVLGIWILPEIKWGASTPLIQELYLRFAILPLGKLPATDVQSVYAPAVCGWGLTIVRLAGSALVIAVIEEFFWRGFLYRWVVDKHFLNVQLKDFDWEAFLMVGVLFGLEHNRWLVGILAGAAYTLLMLKTRSIWAPCLAHIVTNLLLGLYVLVSGNYVFW
ncbi:MAG: CAAX prenyl protease-related protein [Candidatus Pacebacteria bacterium]|nr:CAAX prenyl protease-related protein [Candidatus Paceibacterota bacterium]